MSGDGSHDAAFTARSNAQWTRYETIHGAALRRASAHDGDAFKAAIKDRWLPAFRAFLDARQRAVLFLAQHEIERELAAVDAALDMMDAIVKEATEEHQS